MGSGGVEGLRIMLRQAMSVERVVFALLYSIHTADATEALPGGATLLLASPLTNALGTVVVTTTAAMVIWYGRRYETV